MARYINEFAAAETLGLPVATFRHWVRTGVLPGPIADVGLYDAKALDMACDRIAGLGSSENALDAWRQGKERRNGARSSEGR